MEYFRKCKINDCVTLLFVKQYQLVYVRSVFTNPGPRVHPTVHSFVVALDIHLIQLIEGLMIS